MTTINLASTMGANMIYVTKGDAGMSILDETLPLAAAATAVDYITGRGMSIVAGKWTVGATAATDSPMYFLVAGLDINNAPDVTRTVGMPYSGAAKATCWSVFSRVQLATTAFLGSDNYVSAAGLPLTLSAAASTAGSKGLLCLRTAITQPTYGFVGAKGTYTNEHGYSVLDFYPAYMQGVGALALRTL